MVAHAMATAVGGTGAREEPLEGTAGGEEGERERGPSVGERTDTQTSQHAVDVTTMLSHNPLDRSPVTCCRIHPARGVS